MTLVYCNQTKPKIRVKKSEKPVLHLSRMHSLSTLKTFRKVKGETTLYKLAYCILSLDKVKITRTRPRGGIRASGL